jgi:hypothetical protein
MKALEKNKKSYGDNHVIYARNLISLSMFYRVKEIMKEPKKRTFKSSKNQ